LRVDVAVITAAGLGTRMLPFSKEIPKEMLPVILRKGYVIYVVPALHYIFESLYDVGIRRFVFVVGRGKRVIEDYFTPDWNFVEKLLKKGKEKEAKILEEHYRKVESSFIVMINQPQPKGFGDAVLRAKDLIFDEYFLVHAGDDIIYPNHSENILYMLNHCSIHRPDALLLYEEVDEPWRYGVIVGEDKEEYIVVRNIVEKPRTPPGNRVVIAIYIFTQDIFRKLEETKPGSGEHQLTDAINKLIDNRGVVHAIRVRGLRLDLGTPESYLKALEVMVSNR